MRCQARQDRVGGDGRPGPQLLSSCCSARAAWGASASTAAPGGHRHATAAPSFVTIDLGTLGGGYSGAMAINDDGQVVGGSDGQAFLWENGKMVAFDGGGWPMAINSSGEVIVDGYGKAFLWSQQGGRVDLGSLGGYWTTPVAINESGQVVGRSQTPDGENHGFLWTKSRGMVALPMTDVLGLGDNGQVIGLDYNREHPAVSWTQKDGVVEIGTLGGEWSWPYAINASGEVVGASTREDRARPQRSPGRSRVEWSTWPPWSAVKRRRSRSTTAARSSAMVTFPATTPLGTRSRGRRRVGWSTSARPAARAAAQRCSTTTGRWPARSSHADGQNHAFSWTQAGGIVDLGTLGGQYTWPTGINNHGQIVGNSFVGDQDFVSHGVLWQPPLSSTGSSSQWTTREPTWPRLAA